ncbi:hypothetical protein ACHAXR_011174 [Thalassiosira sp. AJA248-18]
MMQPSLPPSPNTASSIYEAIKYGNWEGLLKLYATTAYDAVRSAEFARRGGGVGSFHGQHSSPPSLMAAMAGGPRKGVFRDEKKLEGAHHLTASPRQSFQSSPAASFSSSSPIHELDLIVREIIGAEIFDGHHRDICETHDEQQDHHQPTKQPPHGQPNKKTRQHSPNRKTPPGLSALDHILFHSHSPSSPNSSRREKDMDWEKIMWESSSILSNSRPSPSFVVNRQDRQRRSGDGIKSENNGGIKSSMEGFLAHQAAKEENATPIFEGDVANATPGDLVEGGTGSGTAQHLACLLDSPFALAILIVLGVNVEARHTAFRRLAIHEAACADSPRCLGLLMEVGTRFSAELFRDTVSETASSPAAAVAAGATGDSLKSASTHSFASSSPSSFASASTTGFDSFGSEMEERNNNSATAAAGKKPAKKKFLFGWHKGKTLGGSGGASNLKKSLSEECGVKVPEHTPFPVVLRVMWEAAKFLRSGDMTEMDAAHYVLDRVTVSNRAMIVLALQCPPNPPNMNQSEDKAGASVSSSPFALIPGLSAVNQLFQPNHRDMQSSFIKRNVDGHGNTPLHWAAFKNSVRAMDVILSYNVDVNSRAQPSGWTPLHDAAYSDAADAVARLIAAGALVDARSHSGATPLCFAAQEDAPDATRMLLQAGANPSMRCLGNSPGTHIRANNADNNQFHSRFSGYTPLHYCAHYNAAKAARVLLYERNCHHRISAVDLLEIPDLNEKLPIHVAVARGSSLVLRELLHGGARVETSSSQPLPSPRARAIVAELAVEAAAPVAIPRSNTVAVDEANTNALSTSPGVITPVSSPVLRAMIPSQPITSSKPWNCLSQKSIDACKHLIGEVEMNWTPERHVLFSPSDRVAVVEVLRVGKRMEQVGRGIFLDLWPHVLSFCGRGWFESLEDEEEGLEGKVSAKRQGGYDDDNEEEISMQCSTSSSSESSGDDMEESSFTQFQMEETNGIL